MNYPIRITRDQIMKCGPCEEGIEAFDLMAPGGVLTVAHVAAHVALLSSPLALFEGWAIDREIIGPIVAIAGDHGTATAGNDGAAFAGDYGTAAAGRHGTATAGVRGTASAGDRGKSAAGDYGTAAAGKCGTIQIRYYDSTAHRYRTLVGYPGEDGIKPNTPYRVKIVNGSPVFVEVA